jgi:cobalt-zinc-cadmium efflux system protein
MIGSGVIACSCHVVVAEQSVTSGQRVREAVETALHEQFRINHTTIQVETEGCESAAMYCSVETLRKK